MKIYRCRICGETFVGYEKPSNCPFCGAHESFLVLGETWQDEFNIPGLSALSRKNLEQTLEFEISNAQFYLCAAKQFKGKNNELEGMFKRLHKIEAEHASTARKFLKNKELYEGEEFQTISCPEDAFEDLNEGINRETNAMKHYAKFAKEAIEPRLQEFWRELVNIETDHKNMEVKELEKLQ